MVRAVRRSSLIASRIAIVQSHANPTDRAGRWRTNGHRLQPARMLGE
jgi:hypothetical protein